MRDLIEGDPMNNMLLLHTIKGDSGYCKVWWDHKTERYVTETAGEGHVRTGNFWVAYDVAVMSAGENAKEI
jgi:hypothetical protein